MAGGGSGGHITPLLSLARELKVQSPNCRVVYVGPKGDKAETLSARYGAFDAVHYIPAGKFRRYHGESFFAHVLDIKTLLLNARDFFKVIVGIFSARKLLKTIKPDVLFSKGSFVAVPVGIAAHWARVPIVTHDSDVVPGLANRIIGRWAANHATGQPAELYSYSKDKAVYTGIPVDDHISRVTDAQIRDLKRRIGLPARAELLLIAGGSLGAASINDKIVKIMPKLLANYPNLHVIHITGAANETKVKSQYELDPADVSRLTVLGFTNEYVKYASAADLIVSRGGATALAEFAVMSKAVLLIPAEHLSGGHQLANAKKLSETGAVHIVPDQASPEELYQQVTKLLDNPKLRKKLAESLSSSNEPQAAAKLARLILAVAMPED
jgi:UDP-N-acetylglucosamine--N-acetylmuramyl-(pentapeptide) pyrophosphoryl-undecaprenol N-acetylglucosamine transferase